MHTAHYLSCNSFAKLARSTADGNIYMELITRYWRVHFNYVGYAHARFAYYANNLRNSLTNLFRARNASVNFHYLLLPFEVLEFNVATYGILKQRLYCFRDFFILPY